jgi:hypothetical protein
MDMGELVKLADARVAAEIARREAESLGAQATIPEGDEA